MMKKPKKHVCRWKFNARVAELGADFAECGCGKRVEQAYQTKEVIRILNAHERSKKGRKK